MSGTFTNNRDELIGALNDLHFGNPTRLNDGIAAGLTRCKGSMADASCWCSPTAKTPRASIGFKTVLERARDEEVMVYSIGLESEYFNGMRMRAIAAVARPAKIADETGGGYFELKKTADLAPTFYSRRAGAPQPVPARASRRPRSTGRSTNSMSR